MSRIVRLLAALVIVLALAGVAGLGALGVMRARDDAFAQEIAAARERARTIATIVHDSVRNDFDAVVVTTARPFFRLDISRKNYFAASPFLSELIATHPRLASVAIYDAGGTLVYRIPGDPAIAGRRFGQQEYFRLARNSTDAHISKLFVQLGTPKGPVIAYSKSIGYRAGTYGVLVGTTPIKEFDAMVAPYAPAGSIVHIYNASGEKISPSAEASGKTYTTDPTVAPALAGRSRTHRSGNSIVISEPVPDLGWAVVVSQQTALGDKRVQDLTIRLSWLAGGATLLALIAATAAWRRHAPHEG